ncbi:hypothetical protein ScPMuIL_000414 [Solemya velum]
MANKCSMLLVRASNCVHNYIHRETLTNPSFISCYQQKRGRRRTCKPPSWFVRRSPTTWDKDLTPENKEFLHGLVEDECKVPVCSPLRDEPWPRGEWTRSTRRTGVLAIKLSTIPQWTKDGRKVYTTLLQVLDNHVIRYTPPEDFRKTAGWKPYWGQKFGSVVVGALSCDPRKFSKEYNHLFMESGVPPKRKLTRFIVTPDAAIEPGTPLTAMHFRVGDYVDCQAKTIGHGFQGVVKRWGMKGMPASHGVTKSHRKMGGTGGGGDKGGIWKGKKMPGHMGMDWSILKGLKIVRVNTKFNILYVVSTSVPGPTNCYVRVYDTVLPNRIRATKEPPPMPTCYPEDISDELPEELFHEDLFRFTEPSISYAEEES